MTVLLEWQTLSAKVARAWIYFKGVYSSSRLVTLLLVTRLQQELLRGEVVQRLVGTDRVIGVFPGAEFSVQLWDEPGAGGDLIEFLRVGALSAFHAPVKFGGAGRQDKQAQAALAASRLKVGGELTAAVDLDGPDREGHPLLQGVQELPPPAAKSLS